MCQTTEHPGSPFSERPFCLVPQNVLITEKTVLAFAGGEKKTILFCTMWELSGSLRQIFPRLCCRHKQEAETRQRRVSLKLREPHQSLPSLAKGVIYHSSASNYSPLPFHL